MPGRCCVPLCNNQIGGFTFPMQKALREKWVCAVKRVTSKFKPWSPSKHDVVCSSHFVSEDFRPLKPFAKGVRRLKKDIVPSVFSFRKPDSVCALSRRERAQKRQLEIPDVEISEDGLIEDEVLIVAANEEVEDSSSPSVIGEKEEEEMVQSTVDVAMQCNILTTAFYRIERFLKDTKSFKYLTGFEDYAHFKLLFNILGPACYELRYKSKELDPENELFLTLIKLRQASDDEALAIDFNISRSIVSRIVKTWIIFMYYELSDLDFWPDRATIDEHFPSNFKAMFPTTRVILDATEIPIQRKKNCDGQRITFSSYKNCNTLKTMIGISPRGIVTYISPTYGGSTSDRQIMERSELLTGSLLSTGDSIMADRGIMVQDLFASKGVQVNTPTTMKGRNQHDPETVVKDRRIASKRIHVERVIGYAKTFKILRKCLSSEKIPMGSMIVKVCFLLTNFRESIVGKRA